MATQTPSQVFSNYDVIAIQNIDTEDFTFEYGKSEGNYPYTIPAGEVKRFPRFLAEHAVKHLIDKMLNKDDKRTNDMPARQDLANRIVIDEEVFQQGPIKTEADVQREEVERLNKPSDLDDIIGKMRAKEPTTVNADQPMEQPVEPTETFEGLTAPGEEPLKGDELDTTDDIPEVPVEVKAVPTRNEIYAYGRKQGLVIAEKEQKVFDKMKVEDLLKEVGDPREALR